MKCITFTMDGCGFIHRSCANQEVEVHIFCPGIPLDRACRWSSVRIGAERVDSESDG